ncbi:MAG: NTP pyrophosphatase (non-canonical NTP hydrolase) [Candidatus Latescibacterota bacterium]|jgi:NTP pyrophosphatase (non-canonical NTP hydrolase)
MQKLTPEDIEQLNGAIPLHEYERLIEKTDRFLKSDLTPILLGLYGEVGSIMSASKKYHRENKAYVGYKDAVVEEFGDAIWYFTALCRRMDVKISDVFASSVEGGCNRYISANDQTNSPLSQIITPSSLVKLDGALLHLGFVSAQLLKIEGPSSEVPKLLIEFARVYLQAMQSIELSFAQVLKGNVKKAFGRFSIPALESLPDFDAVFPEEEQLPRKFEIHITQRKSGQCYLRWNGVFIGSPLTDNIKDPDDYRFHDVFHFAHAAILHWSPTFRALIKQKRKSDPVFDEAQDGGRAIVVEEGLTAWLFSYSKDLDYFEGHDGVSFDVLKTIQKFVHGYEVEQCPLKLWEDAILQGYSVFRQIRKNNGGVVVGDREKRRLSYRSIGEPNER